MVYGAAKAAVIHLTKCVAMELGESGIRVNSISPGAIATGIFGKALGLSVEAAEKTPDVMREIYKTAQPIPRAGLPEDIAHAAVFLASDESSFINGHDLVVDGAITGGRNWTAQQQGYVACARRSIRARGRAQPSFRDGAPAPDPESANSGFDRFASPRHDEHGRTGCSRNQDYRCHGPKPRPLHASRHRRAGLRIRDRKDAAAS